VYDLSKHHTLVFDCDGVVLNSNALKSRAFYETVAPVYGREVAKQFVDYHKTHGGISRWVKFRYLLEHIVGEPASAKYIQQLCEDYASRAREGLMACSIAENIIGLRDATAQSDWMMVSGGAQDELREIFEARGIANLFNAGIFGSPATKSSILEREHERGLLRKPALMFGDSAGDFEAAQGAGLDFIFVSGWSEMAPSAATRFSGRAGFLGSVERLGLLVDGATNL